MIEIICRLKPVASCWFNFGIKGVKQFYINNSHLAKKEHCSVIVFLGNKKLKNKTIFKISEMQTEIKCLFILSVVALIATTVVASKDQERFFIPSNSVSFTTFTLVKITTTTTSTYTSLTTCTTSTAILSSCTTGRRRRGLFHDDSKSESRHRRSGLFYNESEAENNDGTVFLPM